MQRIVRLITLFAVPLALHTGCTTTGTSSVSTQDFLQSMQESSPEVSRLVAGDSIEVSVEVDGITEVSLHRAKINHNGVATLPLVGDVRIGDLNLDEVRDAIAQTYGAYYVNPPVIMVALVDAGAVSEWGSVTIMGRVARPGRVPLKSKAGIKLSEAVQAAGGFAGSAKQNDIRVSRTDENGKKLQISIDFQQIGQEGNAEADLSLIDGDIIYVPERIF